MAVQVADTLKPKNGLDFPVVESEDIKGGLHCVASDTDRDELLTSDKCVGGMLIYVAGQDGQKGKTYQVKDDLSGVEEFAGALDSTQLETILEYVEANIEHSKYTEEEGVSYLEIL